MPLIKIPELSYGKLENASLEQKYLYKDLLLDLEMDVYYNEQLDKGQQLRDLKPIFDLDAVKNSIVNAFLTAPGQKIFLRKDIEDDLPRMEPRIELQNVNVIGKPDENRYDIFLQINVPSLNAYGITLEGRLNKEGYYIV